MVKHLVKILHIPSLTFDICSISECPLNICKEVQLDFFFFSSFAVVCGENDFLALLK